MVIISMFYACDVCPHERLSLICAEQQDSYKKVIFAQNSAIRQQGKLNVESTGSLTGVRV